MKKLLAEFLGTFTLVFAGTGAIISNELSGGSLGHGGVALTFGMVVFAMIQTFGDISGAHLNPAVTLGFSVAGRFPRRRVPGYILAQVAGGFAASGLLAGMFPESASLGATMPAGSWLQSFVMETILSAVLMLTILSVSAGAREKGVSAALTIGAVVGLEALFAGPVSGASMNPARSLAPALVSGQVAPLWIYLTAPLAGALLAVPLCAGVREKGCCAGLCRSTS